MSLTRFAVLPDERRVLMGKDLNKIFQVGIVYDVIKFDGEFVIRPLGEYALPKIGEGGFPNEGSTNGDIMYSGLHLITKEEREEYLGNS